MVRPAIAITGRGPVTAASERPVAHANVVIRATPARRTSQPVMWDGMSPPCKGTIRALRVDGVAPT